MTTNIQNGVLSNGMTYTPSPTLPTHLFAELTSLDELSFPTSSSTRIKVVYTI
jgi:hypothetical protein